MPDRFDPYTVLQVTKTADAAVIQAAYRALARIHHPDNRPDDPEAGALMVRLNAAREILLSPELRAAYDQEAQFEAQTTPAATLRNAPPVWRVGPDGRPGWTLGTILDFGRYTGWSLGEIARVDLNYLEWLIGTRVGLIYRNEIARLIEKSRPAPVAAPPIRKRRFARILG